VIWLYSSITEKMDDRPPGENWMEEVRLMNGELLVVVRRHIYGDVYRPDFYDGPLTEATVSYTYKGKEYRWQRKYADPMSLQIEPGGRHVIVATYGTFVAWEGLGRPERAYLAFADDGSGWREVPIDSVDQSSVFNLAPHSRDRSTRKPQAFVKESAWRWKDFRVHSKYRSGIISGQKSFFLPKESEN
jgi:hypothetical protein